MKREDEQPRQVLIVNCWHDSNKGDAAITIGLLNALVENGLGEHLSVASYAAYSSEETEAYAFRHVRAAHPSVELVPTSVPALVSSVGTRTAFWLALRGLVKLLAPGMLHDKPMEATIRKTAAVVSTGGLYFGFVKSSFAELAFHLFSFSYPLLFARRLGIPYFLYAQSFGPFNNWFSRWWMRRLVNNSAGTWSRESYSQKTLSELGAKKSKLDVVPDAAFGIDARSAAGVFDLSRYGLTASGYVAISIRPLDAYGHQQETELNYREVFRKAIEWLVREKHLQVVLMAHTMGPIAKEDDRGISREVWQSLDAEVQKRSIVIVDDLGPMELAQLYGSARFVIATRFHAVVLSLCGGSPAIAIPYFGLKTQGSLNDMGLSDSVIELGSLTLEALQAKSSAILENGEDFRRRFQEVARVRYEAAMQTGRRLGQVIRGEV